MDRIYHIYAKNKCIYHSLNREEFENVWETLSRLVEIYTELRPSDIEYIELTTTKNELEPSY
jgi:hypothetical protein